MDSPKANRELVHSRYRFVFEEKKYTAKGWRYQIVCKPHFGRARTVSGWLTTADGAWRGAAERIRGEDERARLLAKLDTIKNQRTPLVSGEPEAT